MKIAVIGAGVMGADVAMCFAAADYDVILKDKKQEALDEALQTLEERLRLYRLLNPTLNKVDKTHLQRRIQYSLNYEPVADADWVIENVPEQWSVKEQVYRELSQFCRDDTCFAINTSCTPVTKLAALLPNPQKVIGLHFMNPVPVKKVVEVISGYHTSADTVARAEALLSRLKKNALFVNDSPGFVANRLSHLFMNEAAFLVQEGVSEPATIDAMFKSGYGHAMGPLETADLIGLDTVVDSLKVLFDSYRDPKFRCCPLLQKMVDAGVLGRKSGQGFYSY